MESTKLNPNCEKLLKLIQLKNKPYAPFLPFEILFDKIQPLSVLFKTGRQVSKTTSFMVQSIVQAVTIPNFNILYVAPRESQSIRASTLVLNPILQNSPLSKVFPLQREQSLLYSFKNSSNILFSYAWHDAERVRGIACDKVHIDEIQDIQYRFLPIILETLSASKWNMLAFTGTPKTLNNTLHFLWSKSSQAEWVIKCEACNKWNIPGKEYDLEKMIGPYREDISPESPATICANCGKVIFPEKGNWIHAYPERKASFSGYHIPQIIIPFHYEDKLKWSILLSKREGSFGMSYDNFCQEVLGEASDVSERLLSLKDLLSVAVLGKKEKLEENLSNSPINPYPLKVLGIDWGGGGEEGNFTTLALVCLSSSGIIHVPWGKKLLSPHDHFGEAKEILEVVKKFSVDLISHDYSGSGSLRETILVHSGFPVERLFPCRYVGSVGGATLKFVPASNYHPRSCYHIDPSKCLLLTCDAIKLKKIFFFDDDYVNEDNPGLLRHFLSLVDDSKYSRGLESYRIIREPGLRDEFAQATMLGCLAIWHKTGVWPVLK